MAHIDESYVKSYFSGLRIGLSMRYDLQIRLVELDVL